MNGSCEQIFVVNNSVQHKYAIIAPFLNKLLLLAFFSKSEAHSKQCSLIPDRMTLMNQFFLVNQKLRTQPMQFKLRTD